MLMAALRSSNGQGSGAAQVAVLAASDSDTVKRAFWQDQATLIRLDMARAAQFGRTGAFDRKTTPESIVDPVTTNDPVRRVSTPAVASGKAARAPRCRGPGLYRALSWGRHGWSGMRGLAAPAGDPDGVGGFV